MATSVRQSPIIVTRSFILLTQPYRMQVCDDPQSTRVSATLEVPGLQKEDLSIDREGDRLIVSGERRSPMPTDSAAAAAKYPIQEFKYGKYRRVINLSPGTQVSIVSAFYSYLSDRTT